MESITHFDSVNSIEQEKAMIALAEYPRGVVHVFFDFYHKLKEIYKYDNTDLLMILKSCAIGGDMSIFKFILNEINFAELTKYELIIEIERILSTLVEKNNIPVLEEFFKYLKEKNINTDYYFIFSYKTAAAKYMYSVMESIFNSLIKYTHNIKFREILEDCPDEPGTVVYNMILVHMRSLGE